MPGTYRIFSGPLLSGQILAELNVTEGHYVNRFNDSGLCELTVGVPYPKTTADFAAASNMIEATIPAASALYIVRDTRLVWGGIIWNRAWTPSSASMKLSGREFISYFDRRRIRNDLTYTNWDIIDICTDLLRQAQTYANGNISVSVNPKGIKSGQLTTIKYQASQKMIVETAITELASSYAGFDHCIDVAFDATGNITKVWNPSYPFRGLSFQQNVTGAMFEYPGNITDYDWPEDGLITTTHMFGFGSGSGTTMLQSEKDASSPDMPLLEDSASYKDVTSQWQLDNLTQGDLNAVSGGPVVVPVLTTNPDMTPTPGTFSVGDEVRVRITDPQRFPPPPSASPGAPALDAIFRAVVLDTSLPSPSGTKEIVKVTLAPTASTSLSFVRRQDTFATHVRRMNRRLMTLEST